MYGKARKIKMNPQVCKSPKIVEPLVNKSLRKFKSNGYGKFKYPTYEEVPSGEYFSKIIRAQDSTTSNGNYAVELFLEIRKLTVCYKIANGLMTDNGKDGIFYIRLKLSECSPYYPIFVDSMAEALNVGGEEFVVKKVKGVTEHIKLAYNGDYANIVERFPFEFEWYKEVKPDEEPIMVEEPFNEYIDEANNEDDDFEFEEDWLE